MNRIFIKYVLQNAKEIRDISRMQMKNKLSYAITPSSRDPQQALMNNDLPYQTRNFIMKHRVRLDHSVCHAIYPHPRTSLLAPYVLGFAAILLTCRSLIDKQGFSLII